MRRIITGHNEAGKSVVSIEGPPARSLGEDAGGLYEIWNTDGGGFDTKSLEDRADTDVVLSPSKGGTKIRYFQHVYYNIFIRHAWAPTAVRRILEVWASPMKQSSLFS